MAAARPTSRRRAHCSPRARARGPNGTTTTCDLLADLDRFAAQPPHVRQVARELSRLARRHRSTTPSAPRWPRRRLRRALFAGFADRLARRRGGGADRLTLASGHGAVLARESGVRDGEFLVALDVRGAESRRRRRSARAPGQPVDRDVDRADRRRRRARARCRAPAGCARSRVERVRRARPQRDAGGGRPRRRRGDCWPRRGWRASRARPTPRCSAGCASPDSTWTCRRWSDRPPRPRVACDDIRLAAHLSRETKAALDRLAPASPAGAERPAGPAHLRRRRVGDRRR